MSKNEVLLKSHHTVSINYNRNMSKRYKLSLIFVFCDTVFPLAFSCLSYKFPVSRMCVSECPSGFFRDDRKRCKKCSSLCDTCVGSRSDQCTTCRTGFHLNEGANTCGANCGDGFYLDNGTFHWWPNGLCNV